MLSRYLLPLPKAATLVEFEAEIDGKKHHGVVKQQSNQLTSSLGETQYDEELPDVQEDFLLQLGREYKLLRVPLGQLAAHKVGLSDSSSNSPEPNNLICNQGDPCETCVYKGACLCGRRRSYIV